MNLLRCLVAVCVWLLVSPAPAGAQQDASMELVLLGTGYPYPDPLRAGPSCAVLAGGRAYVVDAGRGVVLRLEAAGIAWSAVRAAFVTHLHSDHIDGLPDLFHTCWQFGAGRPFELYGPEGIDGVATSILGFYAADIRIRRDLTEMLPPEGARIHAHRVAEGVVHSEPGGVRVTAFRVDHRPVEPAFGYRFESGPHSIVLSGDTRPDPNLVRFARGADILVHDAYVRAGAPTGAGPRRWAIYDYHSSAREAGETAAQAGVRMLVLSHLIPRDAPERMFREEAARAYGGRIVVAKDLMRFRVPLDADAPPGR